MKNISKDSCNTVLYMHAGSKNHGCEAIVNSLCAILDMDPKPVLISYRAEEDMEYSLPGMCTVLGEKSFNDHKFFHILYYIYRKLTKDDESFIRFRYSKILKGKTKYPVAVSIGGDNYCYDEMLNDLFLTNRAFNTVGTKTILLGCSIEPSLLSKKEIVEDLSRYYAIIARESLTYNALTEVLKDKGPKIYLIPDPAFTLRTDNAFSDEVLPNTVGINISPMIQGKESQAGIAIKAYIKLIEKILSETDMNVKLIPHVVWDNNDDRKPIRELYEYFGKAGFADRVSMAEDADATKIKGIISKCRLFVGARTHSTIAAYSSCVPTLVVGYSVKALGIAKDLFPQYKTDELVIPVQSIKTEDDLANAFEFLLKNENDIREYLSKKIPEYTQDIPRIKSIVKEAFENI